MKDVKLQPDNHFKVALTIFRIDFKAVIAKTKAETERDRG